MKIYDYWSERGTRPKPKLITNNRIKEIRADFFFGVGFSFLRG